jgi:hypothetical protein
MKYCKSNFNNFSISRGSDKTMAINDYSISYLLPIDIIGVYGSGNKYVDGGIVMKLDMPVEFTCGSNTLSCISTN